jgi:hypothetical protein
MQSLGMTDKHVSAGDEMACQLIQYFLLRRSVEVDDDIAAEDGVDSLRDAIIAIHEIEAPKLDQPP